MKTIKEAILSTIEKQLDLQNEKGMKNYGQSLDDSPLDEYDWEDMANQELIDCVQYQQKQIRKLRADLKTAESFGEMYRLKYIQVVEGGN